MNVILIGYGKMGKSIEKLLNLRNHSIIHIFDTHNISDLKNFDTSNIDLAIEFTDPKSAYCNIQTCLNLKIPIISGTTGWLDKKSEIDDLCRYNKGTFFYATNFSIGMNLMFRINKEMAELVNSKPEFSISIEETHHTEKKDIPSGTAITLATDIINSIDRMNAWQEYPTQDPTTLPIKSLRIHNVPGVHIVTYASLLETIQITHTALSREAFAHGVVAVAEWIKDKKGVLSMDDFLGKSFLK